jgi:hypothetical protein
MTMAPLNRAVAGVTGEVAVAQRHGASCLFPRARIFATVALDGPFGMIADPLRDVGLRGEKALLQRSLPCELQMLLLAQIGLSDLANHHHDLNESHWRHRQALPGTAIYA